MYSLVLMGGCAPSEVLLMVFTNKSAGDLEFSNGNYSVKIDTRKKTLAK